MGYLELTARAIFTLLMAALGWMMAVNLAGDGYPVYSIVALLIMLAFVWFKIVQTRMVPVFWLYRVLVALGSFIAVSIFLDVILPSDHTESVVAPLLCAELAIIILAAWRPDWVLWVGYAMVWLEAISGLAMIIVGPIAGPLLYATRTCDDAPYHYKSTGLASMLIGIILLGGLAAWVAVLWHRLPVRWAFFALILPLPLSLSLLTDSLGAAPLGNATYLLWLVLLIGIIKMIIMGQGHGNLLAGSKIAHCKRAASPRGAVEYKSYENAG